MDEQLSLDLGPGFEIKGVDPDHLLHLVGRCIASLNRLREGLLDVKYRSNPDAQQLFISLDALPFDTRLRQILTRYLGMRYTGELVLWTRPLLSKVPGLGELSLDKIEEVLRQCRLSLNTELDPGQATMLEEKLGREAHGPSHWRTQILPRQIAQRRAR